MINITKMKLLPADLTRKLQKAMSAAPPPPPVEDPIYRYLRRVYFVCRQLESRPEWKTTLSEFGDAHHRWLARKFTRLIIEITSGTHVTAKMKHKYTTVLRYALANDVKTENLVSFIKKAGGINACVQLAAGKTSRPKEAKRVVQRTKIPVLGGRTSLSRIHAS
jgi:hypothetical protein